MASLFPFNSWQTNPSNSDKPRSPAQKSGETGMWTRRDPNPREGKRSNGRPLASERWFQPGTESAPQLQLVFPSSKHNGQLLSGMENWLSFLLVISKPVKKEAGDPQHKFESGKLDVPLLHLPATACTLARQNASAREIKSFVARTCTTIPDDETSRTETWPCVCSVLWRCDIPPRMLDLFSPKATVTHLALHFGMYPLRVGSIQPLSGLAKVDPKEIKRRAQENPHARRQPK